MAFCRWRGHRQQTCGPDSGFHPPPTYLPTYLTQELADNCARDAMRIMDLGILRPCQTNVACRPRTNKRVNRAVGQDADGVVGRGTALCHDTKCGRGTENGCWRALAL